MSPSPRRWLGSCLLPLLACQTASPDDLRRSLAHHEGADAALLQSNRQFFDRLAEVSVGDEVEVPDADPERLFLAGLAPVGPGRYRRLADAERAAAGEVPPLGPLVASTMPSLPQVDAIAISTVDRPHVETPYVYATLRSLFDTFPAEAQVNLLVGGAEAGYLEAARLKAELGDVRARRVHVWVPPSDVTDHLRGQEACPRGSWNFARGLLSYRGRAGLMFIEDDVRFGEDAAPILGGLIADSDVHLISLYNIWCRDRFTAQHREVARSGPVGLEVPTDDFGFPCCTQGLWISAAIAADLGRHQYLHINPHAWDAEIGAFLRLHRLAVGYTLPSLVQHEGIKSSGGWPLHTSPCFLGP